MAKTEHNSSSDYKESNDAVDILALRCRTIIHLFQFGRNSSLDFAANSSSAMLHLPPRQPIRWIVCMQGPGSEIYKELLLFLGTAGVIVPLFGRLRVSPILGFVMAGWRYAHSGSVP